MKYYRKDEVKKVYEDFISDINEGLYVSPYIDAISGEIFKHNGNFQVYSQSSNKTDYFPDINDLSSQISVNNIILNVGMLELDMKGQIKDKEDMEWFFNGRKQPDQVKVVVQDCYLHEGVILVNEQLKERFAKVEEIIPKKEKIGIYEISTLPVEKVEGNINPAEFQAMIDWASGLNKLNSRGAVIRSEHSTVIDGEDKVIIGD